MAGMLPSPTGGASPFSSLLQQVQPPQGINPLLQNLLDARNARLEAERAYALEQMKGQQSYNTAIVNQLGQLVPGLGGVGVGGLIDQTSRHLGTPLNVDLSHAMQVDPANVRATNATAGAAILNALSSGAKEGIGADVGPNYNVSNFGLASPDIINTQERLNESQRPLSMTNIGTNERSDKTTKDFYMLDPQNPTRAIHITEEQANKLTGQTKGGSPAQVAAGAQAASGAGAGTSDDSALIASLGIKPGNVDAWRQANQKLAMLLGPGGYLAQGKDKQLYYVIPDKQQFIPITDDIAQQIMVQ